MDAASLPRLGRYTSLRVLGQGGQGRVYVAIQRGPAGLERTVALKILLRDGGDLRREARLGGLLRHPHLVDVYEVGQHDGTWFCAMELCEGGSLAGRSSLSARAVVEVGLQVCDALAYAHEELELVHMDLKPANLLVREGAVKVADLGIATARGFEADGRIRGTPRFMAPEQRLGQRVDARTDIFALGRVLEELAGGAPEDEVTAAEPFPRAEARGAPAWLKAVVDRCTEPDPRDRYGSMHELAQALRALTVDGPSLVQTLGPPLPSSADEATPGHLGDDGGPLWGRDEQLEELYDALETAGLVTLKGPAGIGKTRLAREAARRYRTRTGASAWFLDLQGASTETELLHRVAQALDVAPGHEPGRRIRDALAARGALVLVLDNFEPLVAWSPLVAAWAAGAPEARLLVTSRIPLGVAGERVVPVPPLTDAHSVTLLVQRALGRGVAVSGDPGLLDLARRLEGVPLALELAAGRLGVLSVAEVVERLGLSLLRSGRLGLPPRQATLRGALDYSWDLLGPAEQATLCQLSVFRGGFTSDDAEAVLDVPGSPLAHLQTLSEHSLVSHRDGRLRLLETVRHYAAERSEELEGAADAERRHARWFARHGTPAALRATVGPAHARLLRERAADLANLVVATERMAATGDAELAARAALVAATVLRRRGPVEEGIRVLGLALPGCPEELRAELLVRRAALRVDAGQLDDADHDLALAGTLARSDALAAHVEQELGDCDLARGDFPAAAEHYRRALERLEGGGHPTGTAWLGIGAVELQSGRLETAEEATRRAVAELQRAGDRASEASALGNLGIILRQLGRPDEARPLYLEALRINERAGSRASLGSDRANLGILEAQAGRPEQALEHLEASLELFQQTGLRGSAAQQLGNLGEVHLILGNLAEARQRGAEALELHRELGNPRLQGINLQLLAKVAGAAADPGAARQLSTDALACHLAAGSEVGAALAQLELARLDLLQDDATSALRRAEAALEPLRHQAAHHAVARAIRGEALARLGRVPEAREDLDAAVRTLEPVAPSMAVQALCARARALGDPASLQRAEVLSGPARPASPTALDLERTRRWLGRP